MSPLERREYLASKERNCGVTMTSLIGIGFLRRKMQNDGLNYEVRRETPAMNHHS
jgi:hypothetical protein